MKAPFTVDFETLKIENRPHYPPPPVGVAIRTPSGKRRYYAFAHPTGNNCSKATARSVLRDIYVSGAPVLFHNSGFDLDVAEIHFRLAPPANVEDTLYLMFLNNPYESELKLKALMAKYADFPADEQRKLRDWILEHVPEARRAQTKWGEYIGHAPGNIVEPYALDDVEGTFKLWEKFRPIITERGMLPSYRRELALTQTTTEMERSGVKVHRTGLKKALSTFSQFDTHLQRRIRKRLRVGSDFNIGSSQQLGPQLKKRGMLDAIVKTPTGQISTKIDVLKKTLNDTEVLNLLSIHSVVSKYQSTFIKPWLLQSEITSGRILPRFNQTRGRDSGFGGARSGRYSSSDPNLQNITANIDESKNKEVLQLMQKMLLQELDYRFIGLRDFVLPDDGCTMTCVDYDQQELRLLAHFERGQPKKRVLTNAYLLNPKLDVHQFFSDEIFKRTGVRYERKAVKTVVFGIIYGMGIDKLAAGLGEPKIVAYALREELFKVVPGIPKILKHLKRLSRRDEPLITWGGRQYYCEEPRYDKKFKRWMEYEYKMLNYQIQPSAADVTKQGMLNVREDMPTVRIAIQVHDELVCMAPSRKYGPRIAAAMCDMKFNVPMTATVKYSEHSWARVA